MSADRLPRYARLRIEQSMLEGRVEVIQVRPERRAPMLCVDAWDLTSSADHGRSSKRAVTLFQHEYLPVLERLLSRSVDFSQTRRNLSVSGFNLETARGAVLAVGETVLQITGRCHPCSRMEETMGIGGFAAMFGHGGWTASVVKAGVIREGDLVKLHDSQRG